jgi:F-type H+-transporting ATPase subunit b
MEQLGIEPKLLIAQVVNFLIIIVILTKLLYEPILKFLEGRRREIAEGLELTEKMRVEEEKLAAKREKVIETARQEGQKLIDEARASAHEAEKEITAEAHAQAEEILARGRDEVGRMKESLQKDMRRQAVDLAIVMAKRLLGEVISPKDQHKLIASHIKKLESIKES